eukprot:549741-Prorocentrum_minimum.AAC.1
MGTKGRGREASRGGGREGAAHARRRRHEREIYHSLQIWGVECTLAVIGTGGPVNRGNIIYTACTSKCGKFSHLGDACTVL